MGGEPGAVSDATPAGLQHSLPLVVLSPGFINSRSVLTALAEDLASHGYVVAATASVPRRLFPRLAPASAGTCRGSSRRNDQKPQRATCCWLRELHSMQQAARIMVGVAR